MGFLRERRAFLALLKELSIPLMGFKNIKVKIHSEMFQTFNSPDGILASGRGGMGIIIHPFQFP